MASEFFFKESIESVESAESAESAAGDRPPEILAPAGSRDAFLAALAAGADAVYCGLKDFSARMEAKNFTPQQLAGLTDLAHRRGARVYVTLNTLVRPGDTGRVAGIIRDLARRVVPDALICQDLAVPAVARQAGFAGELHLSTLANVSFAAALGFVADRLPVSRVVVPRELSVDELKALAAACPPGLRLETFVHGALCYGVSGRCYWSSFLGGKSGLRGRCVQPCRRIYAQGERRDKFFACQDLGLDVLVKVLRGIPQIAAWKIEGRKKGPHYVYYTTRAYRLLRDHGTDPAVKRDALQLLERALGRATTHYGFLSQRPQHPVAAGEGGDSGLLIGRVKGGAAGPFVSPREHLLPGDRLRVGTADDAAPILVRVGRGVPARGRLVLSGRRRQPIANGTPVFLTDRREAALQAMVDELAGQLPPEGEADDDTRTAPVSATRRPTRTAAGRPPLDLHVGRAGIRPPRVPQGAAAGLWLALEAPLPRTAARLKETWWWLPPVIWPADEARWRAHIDTLLQGGARRFVLNALWQTAFFTGARGLHLWAGPFCNLANPAALEVLAGWGLAGAVVSPELGRDDYPALAERSPLPLGIVLDGLWPLCISRIPPANLDAAVAFTSPRGEQAFARVVDNDTWLFPNWPLDLHAQRDELVRAGFRLLVHLHEPLPPDVPLKRRSGLWNWRLGVA